MPLPTLEIIDPLPVPGYGFGFNVKQVLDPAVLKDKYELVGAWAEFNSELPLTIVGVIEPPFIILGFKIIPS